MPDDFKGLSQSLIIDTRNILEPTLFQSKGFHLIPLGAPEIRPSFNPNETLVESHLAQVEIQSAN